MPSAAIAPPTREIPAPTGWDSRVFVLNGDDSHHLCERAGALSVFAGRHPGQFSELAATLVGELGPGGVRLAVVATSAADLAAKLNRVVDRLGNAEIHAIRDAGGVYFTDAPLGPCGSLALLFPGEGAQYPGMLADLCGVLPEVDDTFDWCDQIAAEAGRPSLRAILHPPRELPAEQLNLGPAILGVLLADLAIGRVVERFRLPVSAVAGHSAGEMAALIAGGALRTESLFGSALVGCMDVMDRQEAAVGDSDCRLLAVGAGKAMVMSLAEDVAPGGVVVAMDNCPHQCVAVGRTDAVTAVEAALANRGIVSERLPVRRPYHTSLFEPWMGPFRELFAGLSFVPPHTRIYCCSTGVPFPTDPAATRELAVNQWVRPVEFAQMVERMYADGVRLFLEAGPRANLSGFVEDILRGRPAVAVPANPHRLSGPTGINRMVAQLLAHQVPLDVGRLFDDVPGRVEWERRSKLTASPRPRASDPVMTAHLAAMEQFLDVQRAVMTAFLGSTTSAAPRVTDLGLRVDDSSPQQPFAFVGSVEEFAPGESVVCRRSLDETEDYFAADHALGGREVSRVDPGQRGLPVLPMTVSLEAMAEAAALLAPGKLLVSIRDVRLRRWLPYDRTPTTLEVRARVISADPARGVVEVAADVRDLGNSFVPDGASKVAAEAVVVMANHYPEPPVPRPFELSTPAPCRVSVNNLRRNMFHGPLFQMIDSLGRCCPEGIEGTLTVGSRDGWLRSNQSPRVVFDPILADSAMHLIGAWHLEQPDWTGRILLPFEVNRLELFGPPPLPGVQLKVRGRTEQESARHFRHGLEVLGPDGRVWQRMTGVGYWRFYLPFGHVNFYGPKDEYYLSRDWPAATAPGGRCFALRPPADLLQPVLRMSGARVTLTPRELQEFETLSGPDEARTGWLFTRLLAKDAVRAAWADRHGERLFPADIQTEIVDGRVIATPRGEAGPEPYPTVGVADLDGLVVGFAAFAPRVGVAVANHTEGPIVAARRAVASALSLNPAAVAASPPDDTGRVLVVLPDGDLVVAVIACDGDIFVATTRLEIAS